MHAAPLAEGDTDGSCASNVVNAKMPSTSTKMQNAPRGTVSEQRGAALREKAGQRENTCYSIGKVLKEGITLLIRVLNKHFKHFNTIPDF